MTQPEYKILKGAFEKGLPKEAVYGRYKFFIYIFIQCLHILF